MTLYDTVIQDVEALMLRHHAVRTPFDKAHIWKSLPECELILRRDAAFALGGGGHSSLNFTCVTSSDLIPSDEVVLLGPDLPELTGDVPFARIALLTTGELVGFAADVENAAADENDAAPHSDPEALYRAIRAIDYVKYHVYPKGYMVRVSASTNAEEVRVSKAAVAKGIRFSYVGNTYIKAYKKSGVVKHARVIFVTDRALVEALKPYADKTDAITRTLTHILDGLPTDCGSCAMKPVCDEVEGLRELHMGKPGSGTPQTES